jgi:formiminoglutamase
MNHFKLYSRQDILSFTRCRKFETKLGERVTVLKEPKELKDTTGADLTRAIAQAGAEYVLIGIPEDIGIRANDGEGSGDGTWQGFLKSFLNMQSNDFLEGDNILVLGYFDFRELHQLIEANAHDADERLEAYRHAVHNIDEEVEPLIKVITAAGKIPIVIGSGHNNSYPLIKGAAKGLHKAGLIPLAQVNCVNLSPYSGFSPIEGRHGANGLRYAEEDGYLEKYCVIGVHEEGLQQNVWLDFVNNPFLDLITYEDLFVLEKRSFPQSVAHATTFTEDNYIGLELDLDGGVSPLQARQYVTFAATDSKIAYLHICEGNASMANGQHAKVSGQLISTIVSDFIKARD